MRKDSGGEYIGEKALACQSLSHDWKRGEDGRSIAADAPRRHLCGPLGAYPEVQAFTAHQHVYALFADEGGRESRMGARRGKTSSCHSSMTE